MKHAFWPAVNALNNPLVTALILQGHEMVHTCLARGWPELFTEMAPAEVGPFPLSVIKAEVSALMRMEYGPVCSYAEAMVLLSEKYGFPCLEGGIMGDDTWCSYLGNYPGAIPMTATELKKMMPVPTKKRCFPEEFHSVVKVGEGKDVTVFNKNGKLVYDSRTPGERGNVLIGGVPCYASCLNHNHVFGTPVRFFDLLA